MIHRGQHWNWFLGIGRRVSSSTLAMTIVLGLPISLAHPVLGQTFKVIYNFAGSGRLRSPHRVDHRWSRKSLRNNLLGGQSVMLPRMRHRVQAQAFRLRLDL